MAHLDYERDDDARVIRLKLRFDKDDVRLEETPMGLRVQVTDCHNGAPPGAPALPRRLVHVAIPDGMWPEPMRVEEGRRVALTREPTLVVPAQPLRPGVPPREGADDRPPHRDCHCECCQPEDPGGPGEDPGYQFEPFPSPDPVPPDPARYENAARDPRPAVLTAVDQVGPWPVVAIDLRPVRYTDKGLLELVGQFLVEIPYSPRPRERATPDQLRELLREWGVEGIDPEQLHPLPAPVIASRAQAKRYAELARGLVVNRDVVDHADDRIYVDRYLPADYLIITDNQSWDADAITPTGPLPGDLVAQFERLASHKRSRGLSAKVVTVGDIVNGRYGDFRTGSRDLQEVIRRFLKHVHQRWGVAWVLLGGDVAVVPARYAAGAIEGHMDVATSDPPEDNKSFWTGSYLKMHVVRPGTWWPGMGDRQLVNAGTGALIPYDATGATASGGLGWYWTTDDYSTVSAMPTEFVRVNGPASVVNARLQWLYQWNRIPTDLYYSSLQSWAIGYHEISLWLVTVRIPYVYYPAHDWDALGNGIYGQYVGGADVDGVHWHTDVSVGRAPVQNATEAQAFVDKVIGYENYSRTVIMPGRASWPSRLLIASANWGGGARISRTTADPPGNNRFRPGSSVTLIRLQNVPPDFNYQLIAEISDTDRRELPLNLTSSPTSRGWHYVRSATDHTVNTTTISIWTATFEFPAPSNWIVVHGPADELDPPSYLLDHVAQDGSMADQEELREQLSGDLPGWSTVSRLYEDLTDLTPAQQAAAPVSYLTTTRLRNALNAAPHVVSLSGHGSPDGCCGGAVWLASALTNGGPGFIGYADSCLTGASDSEDSFAETLLNNPNGGAVAYVGSTRFSWIGLGDDVQRAFFKRLTTTRHLGLLNDSRMSALDFNYWHAYARWVAFSLTLFGDPEMSVWRRAPSVIWPKVWWRKRDFRVPIDVELPKPPRPDPPLRYLVHVVGQGGFERSVRGGAGETVRIDVSDAAPGELTVRVAADDGDSAPYTQTFEAGGPLWLSGSVTGVSHRHDGRPWTEVSLHTAEGVRRLAVAETGPEHDLIVQAVMEAHSGQLPISLLADQDVDGARVERFRLPGEQR